MLILLAISDLGIFRVVKTATLISVKQLIHSNLQVALQNAEMCRPEKSLPKKVNFYGS